MKNNKHKFKIVWSQFILRLFILALFGFFIWIFFIFFKLYNFEKKEIIQNTPTKKSTIISAAKEILVKNKKELRGENQGRINILLLGMGGEGHKGKYLTDTIILASIDPTNYETALLSIPRDLYVEIPESYVHTKINAVYAYGEKSRTEKQGGIESIRKTVEDVTSQSIDYYLTIDFNGFKKVIDELGGVIIQVESDLVDHRYPGPGNSYETFEIKKGTHLVNGDVALKYARVRHVAGGDFSRLKRQQEIISSVKRRALSIKNFVNPARIGNLLDILSENTETNIALDEIPAFIELFKNINTYKTNAKVLDAWSPDSLLAVSHILLGNVNAFILVPRTGNYNEIKSLAKNIFNLEEEEMKKGKIAEEKAHIQLLTTKCNNKKQVTESFKKMNYQVEITEDLSAEKICKNKISLLAPPATNKYFTLSDLATKFNASIQHSENFNYQSDILICFPEKDLIKLSNQINQTSADEFDGGASLDNDGNILYNN